MNVNILEIGKPLSKAAQKTIMGGNPCPIGTTVECFCNNGIDIMTGQSPIQPLQLCNQTQFCGSNGGTNHIQCV